MKKAIEIIGQNIPTLEAIDLSENRLLFFDGVAQLLEKLPNIKILHLTKNRVCMV